MLRWILVFLLVALVASVFGAFSLTGTAMWIARVLLFVFLISLVVSLVFGTRAPRA